MWDRRKQHGRHEARKELGVAELAQGQGMCGCREGVVAALLTTHARQGGLRVGGVDAGMVCWDGVRQLFDCAFQLLPLCQTWSSWQGVKRVTRKEKRMELMMQLFRFWLIDVDARGYRLPRASARTQAL